MSIYKYLHERYYGVIIESNSISKWSHSNVQYYTKCTMFRDSAQWHELFSKVLLW